jgi:hypothetical protein
MANILSEVDAEATLAQPQPKLAHGPRIQTVRQESHHFQLAMRRAHPVREICLLVVSRGRRLSPSAPRERRHLGITEVLTTPRCYTLNPATFRRVSVKLPKNCLPKSWANLRRLDRTYSHYFNPAGFGDFSTSSSEFSIRISPVISPSEVRDT